MKYLIAFILIFSLSFPAFAHSSHDLDAWYASWESRFTGTLTPDLIAELTDMLVRHSHWRPEGWPEPPPPPLPSPVPPSLRPVSRSVESWRPLVSSYFPASEVNTALRVMACESGGDPNAVSPAGAMGLMQVMPDWFVIYGGGDPFDPANNLRVAVALLADGGWGHWDCY